MPWAAWKASTIGMIVVVSALLPSQQPTWRGETTAVDQQADDDLGVDPPLFGVADPPQVVLTLGLEVEGVTSYRHRARPPLAVTCSNKAPEIAWR